VNIADSYIGFKNNNAKLSALRSLTIKQKVRLTTRGLIIRTSHKLRTFIVNVLIGKVNSVDG